MQFFDVGSWVQSLSVVLVSGSPESMRIEEEYIDTRTTTYSISPGTPGFLGPLG